MSEERQQLELARLHERAERAERSAARLQQELQTLQCAHASAIQRAEASEAMKNRFLANISHEVRTPMNGILGMTELLLDTKLDEKQSKFTNTIARSTESLLFVINDMLDFSVLHHGKMDLENNFFFFSQSLQDVCEHYVSKAAAKNIELIYNVGGESEAPVIGDEFRIRQVISNLLDNAIKFTEEGRVVVSEQIDTDKNSYRVIIEDTGPGIDASVQPEIFKSFAQADNSSTRKHGGTGLGLAIASRLAQLMDGEIAIQSSPGKGSKFTFSCKLKEASAASVEEIGRNSLQGIRVLVVDDTETNLEIVSLQLQQWELDVHCAASGKEALQMLDTAAAGDKPFQLAILDLNMPHMDGLELARRIQKKDYADTLRLMMLTSSVINLDQKGLEEHGILKSVLKPARQALLYDSINRLLQGKMDNQTVTTPAPEASRTTRILLTEDDPINQEVATLMLESMSYEVVVADNGADALDVLLQDDSIDLILMDCQMPVMDGFNATRAIRDRNVKTPIVALTANATQEDKNQCLEAGMDDFLTKPIHQADLSRVVQQWVSNSSSSINNHHKTDNDSGGIMDIEIDETALDAIRSLQRPGKPDILARIVNMYIEKSPELISAIVDGTAANDSDKVKMAAHTLKSSSAYVGASSLAEVCSRVEASAANDQLNGATDDIQKISDGFTSVVSQIKKYA